ncbi:alpha/beta hydrolase [Streptomonospora nanhaiensis]|uniref:Alpha-beta hydrolase superfamily lysophospholipase n=1 Tax=Streptomonospora nanhaiensis TaxID=1323731 RepID=A0A853BWA9_9ACTN|nr:alpha/beta hydrolase [Streptomonospora nanhaiensis]MBV2364564.1 alpha/beta hydrolase [Streptomonospora nanhaiensis]MBX9390183.1 alpha/beta hydrolase [Streptomonospora nanhaiensis]NYI99086.1 alpha-beta hydrolase superfamily lysophospholipase [Streptomonospora nanhaiensis]
MHERYLNALPAALRPDPLPSRESTWWRWRDTDVHVERVGDPQAAARVLFLHGLGGHAAAMWPYAALLAGRGLRVAVPDLPGFGRTRVPRPGAVRYADWVAMACDLLRAERAAHAGPLVVVGASMGGMLAYDAATRTGAADRVVATCLPDPRDAAVRRRMARSPLLSAAARPALRAVAGPLAGVRVPLRWLTNMRAISNEPGLADLIAGDRRGGGNRMPLGFLRDLLDSAPALEPERATSPGFVLAHPGDDRWTPLAVSLPFFERIAAPKELVVLEGAGHFPVERPGVERLVDAVAAAVPH